MTNTQMWNSLSYQQKRVLLRVATNTQSVEPFLLMHKFNEQHRPGTVLRDWAALSRHVKDSIKRLTRRAP